MEHVQTKREIARLLAEAGIRPRKRLGQHFLIDGNLMRRLVEAAGLSPGDLVLEVGGGTGGLTDLLAVRVKRLVCVELDRNLYDVLDKRFNDRPGITLIQGDILESKHRLRPEVDALIRGYASTDSPPMLSTGGPPGCVKLVANLPYQVATPLVMNLLLDYPQVRRLCFTVQAEVGERITARPNCKAFGPLSIIGQVLCSIQTLAKIPPQAFWPRPAVGSMMIRMDVGESPFSSKNELARFAALVRGLFDHRRKTLRTALRHVTSEEQRARICERFDAARRPESFSVEEWLDIFRTADEVPE